MLIFFRIFAQRNILVMITRTIGKHIENDYNKGKIIVVTGARQVGKTTLYEQLSGQDGKILRLNCDNYDDVQALSHRTSTELKELFEGYSMAIIDEAQRVPEIGLCLKMIADLKLGTQVLVTGSSSLELHSKISEPATGRLFEYDLYPLSLDELHGHTSFREENRLLEHRMVYGLYPEVVTHPEDAKRLLSAIANNYLYKDLLEYKGIKKADLLQRLVRALALQVGSEVSYNELANMLGVDKGTVESYIGLLEQCYVVFRLPSYSNNLRNEIKKGKKIYFYDNGIRNALISNFAPLDLRTDVGALWENLMVSERVKRNAYSRNYANLFFWRNVQQQEVDLIEEQDGRLKAFEFKWNENKKAKLPGSFASTYPDAEFEVVTKSNYKDFVAVNN